MNLLNTLLENELNLIGKKTQKLYGKQIIIRIKDTSLWDQYLEHVEKKHDKNFGFNGLEMENAISLYLKYDLEEISKKEENYKIQLQDLQDKLKSKNEYIHSLEGIIKDFEANEKQINKNLQGLKDNEKDYLKQINNLKTNLNTKIDIIKFMEKNIKNLESDKTKVNKNFQEVQFTNKGLNAHIRVLNDEINKLNEGMAFEKDKTVKSLVLVNKITNDLKEYEKGIMKIDSIYNNSIYLLSNMSFWDRIRGRYPADLEKIEEDINQLKLLPAAQK